MTEATVGHAQHYASSEASAARRRRRYAADRRLRYFGLAAISIALGMLAVLVASLVVAGLPAFLQTHVRVTFPVALENVDPNDLEGANWRAVVQDGVQGLLPGEQSPQDLRALSGILTNNTPFFVRAAVLENPSAIGGSITLDVPASDPYDQLAKGLVNRELPPERRRLSDEEIALFDAVEEQGVVSRPFNWGLFLNPDSRFPEIAGLYGALVGSLYVVFVCFLLCLPVGIATAVYLEEFAPRNRFTDLIEVNINNLAAVPSIVFGLLGLAVFLNAFGLPRSAPLVGGLVLALMTLPIIIIVTRSALQAVPPSIREAALGIGASRHQVILHHVLPLAMPGILTGTIIGLAQALGETAPLLLIGMNAFITSPPGGLLDAATTLPTQVFIWADSPERGFVSRTSAGILVLLTLLIALNAVAIFLRQRLERTW